VISWIVILFLNGVIMDFYEVNLGVEGWVLHTLHVWRVRFDVEIIIKCSFIYSK